MQASTESSFGWWSLGSCRSPPETGEIGGSPTTITSTFLLMFTMTRMKHRALVTAKRIYRLDQGDPSELDPPAIPWMSRSPLGALSYLLQCDWIGPNILENVMFCRQTHAGGAGRMRDSLASVGSSSRATLARLCVCGAASLAPALPANTYYGSP